MYLALIMTKVGTMVQAAHGYFMKKGQIMPEAKCSPLLLQDTVTVSHATSKAVPCRCCGAIVACSAHTALAPPGIVMCHHVTLCYMATYGVVLTVLMLYHTRLF